MKITVLVENTTGPASRGLRPEWGLSLLVDVAGRRILFDTGASGVFATNAAKLGVDLRDVSIAVVSHHHSDHGGGLRRFFEINADTTVYLAPRPAGDCVYRPLPFFEKRVGLEPALLTEQAGRFKVVMTQQELLPGVHALTGIPRRYPVPSGNRYLYLKHSGKRVHDPFAHELVLAIQEADGFVVFSGCSHNGVLNMLARVDEAWPGARIKAVVGGLHLAGLPPLNRMADPRREVVALAHQLLELGVERVVTGHCTGAPAYGVLGSVLGKRLEPLSTGWSFVV